MSQIPNAVESDVDAWVGVHHGPPLVQCPDCEEWGGRHAWMCPSKPLTFESLAEGARLALKHPYGSGHAAAISTELLLASLVRHMEARAAEDAAMHGVDLSGLPSILNADACYECGCIGCSTGCKAGGREE